MTDALVGALHGLGVDALSRASWLLLLLPVAALAVWRAARTPPAHLDWPDVDAARAAGARRADAVRIATLALRACALAALGVVLAGPVGVHRAPPEPGLGLDITLVLDASGSMRALDAVIDGEWGPRLDLARRVVARFAEHRATEGDRVALVVFGENAFTLCPLTGDGALLAAALARVEAGMAGEASALGEALGLAVKRSLGGVARDGAPQEGRLAGRLVVLLTDGRHNAGALSLETATALAASAGVRVHTVAIGSSGKDVAMERGTGGLRFERHDVDAESLRSIATATGGRFFAARRPADLAGVYAEIDRIERVARSLPPRVRRSERPEPLLALAGGLLLSEIALARVAARRLP